MIGGVSSLGAQGVPLPSAPAGAEATGGTDFKDMLLDSLREVNTMQHDADQAVEGLLTGQDVNPAEVLTAVQKADMAFKLMMQIRNKLLAAYNEVQNIRV